MALVRCDDTPRVIEVIMETLLCLKEKMHLFIDLDKVDRSTSAVRAMYQEEDFEGSEDDANDEHKQAIRFVLAAVDFDGFPVIDPAVFETMYHKERCSYLEVSEAELAVAGESQLVRNNLMITKVERVQVGQTYLQYINEKAVSLIIIDEIRDGYFIFHYSDDQTKVGFPLAFSSCGLVAYPNGTWNIWGWLERVGPKKKK